jgi:hypothetical protein
MTRRTKAWLWAIVVANAAVLAAVVAGGIARAPWWSVFLVLAAAGFNGVTLGVLTARRS